MMRKLFPFSALAFAAACSDGLPPTFDDFDVLQTEDAVEAASRLPITDVADLPSGRIIYDGRILLDIDGTANGFLADMAMIVDYSDDEISGGVTNINLLGVDSAPIERLAGSLDLTGFAAGSSITANANGQITGMDQNGDLVESEMDLNMSGTIRTDQTSGDMVVGTVVGGVSDGFNYNVDGVFVGNNR